MPQFVKLVFPHAAPLSVRIPAAASFLRFTFGIGLTRNTQALAHHFRIYAMLRIIMPASASELLRPQR
jgi:hypothetical protein